MNLPKNKEILFLTGANGQLGKAIYEKLFKDYEIYCLDISYTKEETNSNNIKIDISDSSQVTDLYNSINPDVVINNAGLSVFTSFTDRSEKELDDVYEVNLKGTINMINAFARVNDYNKKPKRIINIGSLYGIVSADPRIYTDCNRNSPEIYAATKAGVIQLTKYYCIHLRDINIRVNCVSPGGIYNPNEPQGDDFIKNYSERCPMNKMGSAEDIADGVNFLASNKSSYINGHNLVIDGGFTAW
jgi:NAD(P)-dependent dehydrogenase (short-subunit alcohol dehydrogenase family)